MQEQGQAQVSMEACSILQRLLLPIFTGPQLYPESPHTNTLGEADALPVPCVLELCVTGFRLEDGKRTSQPTPSPASSGA